MIEVRLTHEIEDLRPLKAQMDAVNAASRRKCPFTTWAMFHAFIRHDELWRRPDPPVPWLLTVFEGPRLIGYAGLRAVKERVSRFSYVKLEWLITLEVQRPHVVARPEDEARVAQAILGWLMERRSQWAVLELQQQDEGSEVWPLPAGLPSHRYLARTMESRQNCVVPLTTTEGAPRYPSVDAYQAAFSKKHRSNVKRKVLDTLALDGLEYVTSTRPEARPALLDLYLTVEPRSWKVRGGAAVSKNEHRIGYYQAMLGEKMPLSLNIDVLLHQGVPIAGHVCGVYERTMYFLQTVMDERYEEESPGMLMLALSMQQAIEQGVDAFNMMPDFSYYKSRWLADVVETKTVQLFRKGSLPFFKAILGDFKRRIRPADGSAASLLFNPSRREVDPPEAPPKTGEKPPVDVDRGLIDPLVASLRRQGVPFLSSADLQEKLGVKGAVRKREKEADVAPLGAPATSASSASSASSATATAMATTTTAGGGPTDGDVRAA